MKKEIVIPQLGLMETATIVEWLKMPGERVVEGEAILVVETDKANAEVEAPATGTLEIAIPAGSEPVPVETVLGYVETEEGPR